MINKVFEGNTFYILQVPRPALLNNYKFRH